MSDSRRLMLDAPTAERPERLVSLDVYRGFVMTLMAAEMIHLPQLAERMAKANPESTIWPALRFHTTHVEWTGCSLHDLIQPSFSFLVGAALPFSMVRRRSLKQSSFGQYLHAFLRALVLVFLGIFLRSIGSSRTNFTFEDTLTQIGLGYFILFLISKSPTWVRWVAPVLILGGYWAAFAFHPPPPADFNWTKAVGDPDWPHRFEGFESHWDKNANFASEFDKVFLNKFPRENPFEYNSGGYVTLSFIPTLGTMLLGLIAGGILAERRSGVSSLVALVAIGCLAFLGGWALDQFGYCPIVKRIWTPSWTLYSGGICLWITAGLFAICEVIEVRFWTLPLEVVGKNSIFTYVACHGLDGFIRDSLKTHLGADFLNRFGEVWRPHFEGALTLGILWLLLFWMYRRRLFIRI